MAKATLEFDLSDPDDANAHAVATSAPQFRLLAQALDETMRQAMRNNSFDGISLDGDAGLVLERLRRTLREDAQERGVAHLIFD